MHKAIKIENQYKRKENNMCLMDLSFIQIVNLKNNQFSHNCNFV